MATIQSTGGTATNTSLAAAGVLFTFEPLFLIANSYIIARTAALLHAHRLHRAFARAVRVFIGLFVADAALVFSAGVGLFLSPLFVAGAAVLLVYAGWSWRQQLHATGGLSLPWTGHALLDLHLVCFVAFLAGAC